MPDFDDGLAETDVPNGNAVETGLLIVGSGLPGGAAALCLATLGVPNIMITKYRWTANTPRAHITNQRAMEIFRDLGIEDQVKANATPHALVGDTVFCTSIAGRRWPGSAPGAPTPRARPTISSPARASAPTEHGPRWPKTSACPTRARWTSPGR